MNNVPFSTDGLKLAAYSKDSDADSGFGPSSVSEVALSIQRANADSLACESLTSPQG